MNINKIFRAYDVRGIYPDHLNKEFAYKLGNAFVLFLKKEFNKDKNITIVIGQDGRESSLPLFHSFARGVLNQGANIIDIGLAATDSLYFALNFLKTTAGVIITGSHNPKNYNGFKLATKGPKFLSGQWGLPELEKICQKDFSSFSNKTDIKKYNILPDYKKHILSLIKIDKLKPKNIIVDASGGVAAKMINFTKDKIPGNLDCIYCEIDSNFSNHSPNPVIPGNLSDLSNKVKTKGADFGLAFDGDGDRTVFVDEKGNLIKADMILALFAKHFLKKQPGSSIVYNLTCSRSVPEVIKENNGKPIKNRTGSTFMKMISKKYQAILGGEISGHFCYKDNFFGESGILTLLIMQEILSQNNSPLSQLIKPLKRYYRINETNFRVKNRKKTIKLLSDYYKNGKKDWLDGLSVEFDNWWFNARPSNTEPLLRLVIEANKKSLAENKLQEIKRIINK